jgi:hypothetical protein
MKIFRRPRQVPGPASNRLAVRGRDAQPELAEARAIRVPRPAPGRACLQFVGRNAPSRRADGAAGQPDQSRTVAVRFLLKPGRKYEQAVSITEVV